MKKIFFTFLFVTIHQSSYLQEKMIKDENVPTLNAIIDSLEQKYTRTKVPNFKSLPQTSGHYFDLKTEYPEEFITALKNDEPLDSLRLRFRNLQVDRDLLIIKNVGTTTAGDKKIELKSFDIKNSGAHRIRIDHSDYLNQTGHAFYYSSYHRKKEGRTRIRGFYFNEDFRQHDIPKEYAKWMHYTDIMVQPEKNLFHNTGGNPFSYHKTEEPVIDSLVNYYAQVTQKPDHKEDEEWLDYRKRLNQWEERRSIYADSLFQHDSRFKSLLLKALQLAEDDKKSNGELEFFVAQLVSPERALELIRYNRQVGSCSFDNGPVEQQKRMAKLAAEIPNWDIFIKTFLNVMNDNVSRIAHSNIASNSRKTYIEELTKLDLDVERLLFGSNLRISDSLTHYFSDASKVGKAFSMLDNERKNIFEEILEGLIKDQHVDAFNKLHFYNTFLHYRFFLTDSIRKDSASKRIESLTQFMPPVIRTRIDNPNKELTDLLPEEVEKLKAFEILESSIGSGFSYSYDGDWWMAELREKGENERIIYNLTMPMEDSITPFGNFLEQRETLRKRILEHKFINVLLDTDPGNMLYLNFTGDRSFSNFENEVLEQMPEKLSEGLDFENAISFYIRYPKRRAVRYVLFKNKDVMILNIPEEFTIPGYSFEDLVTHERESFLSTTYESYKLFNESGEMLN